MSKVSYIEVPPGFQDLYKKGLQPGDRFTFSRIRVKDLFLSRARVKGISQRSMLVALSPVWQALTQEERDAWNSAGEQSGLTGWKQFVVDTTERRKAGLSGYATPTDIYQSEVGRILVESPATGLIIEQAHPQTYYVQRKVTGTRSQYYPVAVNEPFTLPLDIEISYKTDLTAIDGSARARFFCVVYSSYQGLTIETPVSVDFGLSEDWTRASASLSAVLGLVRGYSAFIEVYNARGNLYFDNVNITHDSENWARDEDCNNVSLSFTKAFQQVARNWTALNIADGSDFGSIYAGLIA
jgi:hypothetical protein